MDVYSPPSRYSLLQFQVQGMCLYANLSSNLLHKGTVFSGPACGTLVCASAQRSPPSRYTRHDFYLLLWFQNRPYGLDCKQMYLSNFFIKGRHFKVWPAAPDRVLTHVLSPPSRYSLMRFQVPGVLLVCKSASKLDAPKHHLFGLACGALVCASAPTSPPSRYALHDFNLHRACECAF